MGRGASAQLHQVNVQGDEKVMYLYIYMVLPLPMKKVDFPGAGYHIDIFYTRS